MDIVLFNPAAHRGWSIYHRRVIPLGLLHVAAPLDRLGYRVRIIDQSADPIWKKNFFEALSERPLCFGVTSMTGHQIRQAVDACKLVKRRYPDLPIVWGGIHASILPEQTLRSDYVDMVVVGEGEDTFLELVKALKNGRPLSRIAGLAYLENDQYCFTGHRPIVNLNEHASLPYHLIDMNHYHESILGVDHVHMICSRGCPYECAFCWDPAVHKRRFRAMEPGKVLDQMKRVVRDFGVRGFYFGDDNFFANMNWAHTLLEMIVKADLDICIGKFFVRADTLCEMERDFLDLIVRAGCKRLVMGAESGSQRILDLVKKRITVEQIIEANRKLLSYPIRPAYLFMMGLPTETPEEVAQSVHLADQLMSENPGATRSFNIYTPFPGTELFGLTCKLGMEVPQRLQDWANLNYRYIPDESPWILPETKRLITVLDYALMCSDRDNSLGPIKKSDPISVWLAKAYGPLARYRVKTLNMHFPVETKIIKALKWVMGREGSRTQGFFRQEI